MPSPVEQERGGAERLEGGGERIQARGTAWVWGICSITGAELCPGCGDGGGDADLPALGCQGREEAWSRALGLLLTLPAAQKDTHYPVFGGRPASPPPPSCGSRMRLDQSAVLLRSFSIRFR